MDWSNFNRIATLSLPDRLSIEIEKLILTGELEVGSKLPPERILAETLGVSRVSVRQALHELQVRGLIDRRPGRGTVVVSAAENSSRSGATIAEALAVGGGEIANVMELRAIIEPPIASLTASRATDRDITQLRNLVAEMSLNISVEAYADLDTSFHQAIAQYTHNPLLSMLTQQIATLIAPSRSANFQTKRRRANSTQEHENILRAITARDPDAAEWAASLHIESITQEIVRAATQSVAKDSLHDIETKKAHK
jgi:GntR family transcriptional repressor for pyruvate dehydrogenase complex